MECAEVKNRLVELLYDELPADDRDALEKHLDSCPNCAAEYRALLRTRDALDRWPAASAPIEVSTIVNSTNGRRSATPSIRISPMRAALAGAAATLLLVCGLTLAVADTHYADGRLLLTFGAAVADVAPSPHEETEMAEFFLLLHENTNALADATPEQIEQTVNDYRAWATETGEQGHLVGGEKFVDDGGRLLNGRGDRIDVDDPDHADAPDRIGGFFRIKAENYEQAVAISKTCPHVAKYGQTIELRQVHKLK